MRADKRTYAAEAPGTRYGFRTVEGAEKHGPRVMLWMRCDCGDLALVRKDRVVSGLAQSCMPCRSKRFAVAYKGRLLGDHKRGGRRAESPVTPPSLGHWHTPDGATRSHRFIDGVSVCLDHATRKWRGFDEKGMQRCKRCE